MIKATSSIDRIPALDFLRGVAILGILFINIENFAYPDSWSPWKYGFKTSIDQDTRFWVYFLTQGKFYMMFALLFGVGFYIFLERLESKQFGLRAMDIYARRLLWLFIIGVVHAYFIWDGDVLYHYAICGFLLFPFRSLSNRYLWLVVGVFAVLQLLKAYEQTERRKVWLKNYNKSIETPASQRTEDDRKRISFWETRTTVNAPDTSIVQVKKPTYWIGLQETYKHAGVHKGKVYHQGLLFPSLMVMILGIILYREGIFSDYQVWKHYWLISLTILVLGIAINYFRYYQWTYTYFEPVMETWKGLLFTFPKEILSVGYILVLNGVYQKYLKSAQLTLISGIGRMALTNYIFQNILQGCLFYGYGLSLYNQYARVELLGFVFLIWLIQLIFSWLWLRKYEQGPLESLWRKLTYGSFKKE